MIRLRPMAPVDKDKVRTWRNSPEVARYMYTDHAISPEEHERWFSSTLEDRRKRYWIVVHRGEDVGLACLYDIEPTHRRASWAFYLADPGRRGKALGGFVELAVLKYAFEQLGLHKLCCEVLASNRAVLALHERFGFRREGLLGDHVFKGERFHDVVCLGLTRPEWEAKRPGLEELLGRIERRLTGSSDTDQTHD